MTILALDLGRCNKLTHGSHINPTTGEISRLTFPTTLEDITKVLKRLQPTKVVFEISPHAGMLADLLRSLRIDFIVANTQDDIFAWRNRRSKTDSKDCDLLGRMALLNQIRGVHIPDPATREQRALIDERSDLVSEQTQIKNRIRALCERRWHPAPSGSTSWSEDGITELRKRCDGQELWQHTLKRHLDRMEFVRRQIEEVTEELDALATHAPERIRLDKIPGIGPRTAEALAAAIDDGKRFKNAKQVAAYFGLAPRVLQSGATTRHGRITKAGPRIARHLLIECAWIAVRHDAHFRELFKRIHRGSKPRRRIAIVAVARQLAVIAWAMMRDGTDYRPPHMPPTSATAA